MPDLIKQNPAVRGGSINLPLKRLPPIQSLGYLQDGQMLRFKHEGGLGGCLFRRGEEYPVRVIPITVKRTVKRPSHSGPEHEHILTGQDLAFFVTQGDGRPRVFLDKRYHGEGIAITGIIGGERKPIQPHFALETLTAHFEIPTPPDIAEASPAHYAWNITFLHELERIVNDRGGAAFKFKNFQAEDLSTMALLDGVVYGGDCGVGKSLMTIAWSLLKAGLWEGAEGMLVPAAPALIVCPGGIISQMAADYKTLFGDAWPGITRIDSQKTFLDLTAANSGRLAPGFYVSSYQEIALNKFQMLPQIPSGELPPNEAKAYLDFFGASALEECRRLAAEQPEKFSKPSLAELMRDHFAVVAIDEGVHVKGEDTIIGLGVRSLNPKYRLVLTGTPIKNRLPDILFLAAWACDAIDKPNDRWPYAGNVAEFTKEFQVMALDRTQQERTRMLPGQPWRKPVTAAQRRLGVPTAEISNVQKLWRVLAPVVLRRRKCDISEQEIAKKIHWPIIVPMGVEQARVYEHHLKVQSFDARGQDAVGARLMALRACAASPTAECLGKVRSNQPFTPKLHACLKIVLQVLERGEQVVIFSPFHDPLDVIYRFLTEASIAHDVLDGRMTAKKRAQLAMNFKRGLPSANPVLLAGLKACAEGFSWEKCNNVILYTFDWALDLMRQAVDRVHRINSVKTVNVYSIIVAGSIERKLESMLEEKGAAADIALDGAPGVFQTDEMRLEELLDIAQKDFNMERLVQESTERSAWPSLRDRLRSAKSNLTKKT